MIAVCIGLKAHAQSGPGHGTSPFRFNGGNESVVYYYNGTVHTEHASCGGSRNGNRNGFQGIALGAILSGLGHGPVP